MTAKEFFESAREASRDAERIRRQLDEMERRALSVGGGKSGSAVRSTPDPHRMEARVVAYVGQEEMYRRRQEEDYELIDRATSLLYGPEQDGRGGLCAHLVPVYADVLCWRYLNDAPWRQVCRAVGYSPSQSQLLCRTALATIDDLGLLDEEGRDAISGPIPRRTGS